jgi:acetyltransferase-like isoleucine patch superfamily enzyme
MLSIIVRGAGQHDKVSILDSDVQDGNCLIDLQDGNNHVEIATPHLWGSASITLCGNSSVKIGAGCVLGGLVIYAGRGSHIAIGQNTAFAGITGITAHEPSSIAIGEGCLFAADTTIMSSDMHSVLNRETGVRINPAADIRIGPRVWLGFRVIVLKGSQIGEGTVIGAGAVVNGKIEAWCAAAGNPARSIRSGVTWTPALI